MNKANITKTLGPLHFEDLDPHRFEDLIRELIYDFKNWQSIEATGKLGNDEGFDIRAYEKTITNTELDENSEVVENVHPMKGKLWMIQVKREKSITPKKMETILDDVSIENPPYGYILAAATNFSKKSRDTFRNILIDKGVQEFYIFGNTELEDMLFLPKNDRVLFTFFGISLETKKRSKVSEKKAELIMKNRIYKIVGKDYRINEHFLLRDIEDNNYPYENKCEEFRNLPGWGEYEAFENHPLGIVFRSNKYKAYIDLEKKEWDFTEYVDLEHKSIITDEDKKNNNIKRNEVLDVWDYFPNKNKGHYIKICILKFSDMEIIDPDGDVYYSMPHIFVKYSKENEFFSKCFDRLELFDEEIEIPDGFDRIEKFPKIFKKKDVGQIYSDLIIELPENISMDYKNLVFYSIDDRYDYLKVGDVVSLKNNGHSYNNKIQITYKNTTLLKDYLKGFLNEEKIKIKLKEQLIKIPKNNEKINYYEYRYFYGN